MADRQLYLGQDKIVGADGGVVRFDSAQSLTYDQQYTAVGNMGTKSYVTIDLGKRPSEPTDSGTLSNEDRLKIINKSTPFIVIKTKREGTSAYYNDYYQKMWEDSTNVMFGYYNWPAGKAYFYAITFLVNKATGAWKFDSKTIISEDKNELVYDLGYMLMDNATLDAYIPKNSTIFVFDSHATMPKMYVFRFGANSCVRYQVWNSGSGEVALNSITSVTDTIFKATFKAIGSSRARFYQLLKQTHV